MPARPRLLIAGMALLMLTACGFAIPGASPSRPGSSAANVQDPAAALAQAISATSDLDSYHMRFVLSRRGEEAIADAEGRPLEIKNLDYTLIHGGQKDHIIGHSDQLLHVRGVSWGDSPPAEIIQADGATYLHGPLPLPGAADQVWYSLGDSPPEDFMLVPPDGAELLARLSDAIDLKSFAASGAEEIDGKDCASYRAEAPTALAAIGALSALAPPASGQAEIEFWVCDSYVSQVAIESQHGASAITALLRFGTAGQNSVALAEQTFPLAYTHEAGTATVTSGGNVRATPVDGAPQDQAKAGEVLPIYAKSADDGWYLVVTPRGRAGWISVTLIELDNAQAAIPVADGLSTAAQGLPAVPFAPSAPEAGVAAAQPPATEPTATPAPTPVPTPAGQTFSDRRLTITVPLSYIGGVLSTDRARIAAELRPLGDIFASAASYIEKADPKIAMAFYDPSTRSSNVVTNVAVIRNPQPFEGAFEQYIEDSVNKLSSSAKIRSHRVIQEGEQMIGSIEAELPGQGFTLYEWLLIYPSSEEVWIVTLSSDITELDSHSDEFKQIVDSVTIEN